MKSKLEERFATYWRVGGMGLKLEREVRVSPARKFRFDFAHLPTQVAVEIEGGTWMAKGGHTGGKGVQRDCEKGNIAILSGWTVFRLTKQMINLENVGQIAEFIARRNKCQTSSL